MLVQSATSSNFQPRASRIVMATSPPRPPCVGARGGPVCRGQVRGSCPPGATRPSTRSRCRREPRGGSAAAIGRWLARGSAILWRSVQEQSVVPGRPRGRQAHRSRASLLVFFVFVSRGSRLSLNAATLLPLLSLYLSSPSRIRCTYTYPKCVSQEKTVFSLRFTFSFLVCISSSSLLSRAWS